MTSTQYRTPSVHVTETDAFSPSVVGIQTAVNVIKLADIHPMIVLD
jgi:hypothetical protein